MTKANMLAQYNEIDVAKLPAKVADEVKAIKEDTENFTDQEAVDIFAENWQMLFDDVIKKAHSDALKTAKPAPAAKPKPKAKPKAKTTTKKKSAAKPKAKPAAKKKPVTKKTATQKPAAKPKTSDELPTMKLPDGSHILTVRDCEPLKFTSEAEAKKKADKVKNGRVYQPNAGEKVFFVIQKQVQDDKDSSGTKKAKRRTKKRTSSATKSTPKAKTTKRRTAPKKAASKKPAATKTTTKKSRLRTKPAATKKESTPKRKTTRENPSQMRTRMVRSYDTDVRLMKRMANLLGETTVKRVVLLHKAFERSFATKQVTRETTPHASVLIECQKRLINLVEKIRKKGFKDGDTIEITRFKDAKFIEALKKNTKVYPSVSLLNAIIRMHGSEPTQEQVSRLIDRIEKAYDKDKVKKDDPFYNEVKGALRKLNSWKPGDRFGVILPKTTLGNTGEGNEDLTSIHTTLGAAVYCGCGDVLKKK